MSTKNICKDTYIIDYKLLGDYNGFTIIFFHGLGHSYKKYNYVYEEGKKPKKNNFLNKLSKISQLLIYNRPEENIRFYIEENKSIEDLCYPKGDINSNIINLKKFLEIKNIKKPYVLIAHSLGSLYALQFAKKYSNLIKYVFLIDPPQFTRKIAKEEFTYKKLSNKEITNIVDKIKKNPTKSGKLLEKLDNNTQNISYIKPNINCPLMVFWNLTNNKRNTELTIEYDKILQKNNKNYSHYFYRNRDHYLNETNPIGIINKIKKYLKLKK